MGSCLCKEQKQPPQQRRPSAVGTLGPIQSNDRMPQHNGAEPRFVSCEETISATFGRMQVRYGFISQRGYYPDGEFLSLVNCNTFYHSTFGIRHFSLMTEHDHLCPRLTNRLFFF